VRTGAANTVQVGEEDRRQWKVTSEITEHYNADHSEE